MVRSVKSEWSTFPRSFLNRSHQSPYRNAKLEAFQWAFLPTIFVPLCFYRAFDDLRSKWVKLRLPNIYSLYIVPTIQKSPQKKLSFSGWRIKIQPQRSSQLLPQKKTLPKNLWSPMARPTLPSTITESFTVLTCTSSCTSSSATHVRCAPIAIEVTSRASLTGIWGLQRVDWEIIEKRKNCWRFSKVGQLANIQKQMVTGGQKLGIVRHRRIWDLHTPQNRQYLILNINYWQCHPLL